MECFECGAPAEECHHVVPQLYGGKKTVPLCSTCHGRAHGVRRSGLVEMTKRGLDRKRKELLWVVLEWRLSESIGFDEIANRLSRELNELFSVKRVRALHCRLLELADDLDYAKELFDSINNTSLPPLVDRYAERYSK